MGKQRLFLAMQMSPKIQQKVGSLIQELQQKAPEITWINRENLHVTLYFFGEVAVEQIERDIIPNVQRVLSSEPPLDLACGGIGVFPNWKYPKVIWAGITGDTDRLLLLHDHLAHAMAAFKFKKDKRLFRPHLTIGRADKIRKDAHVVQLVEHLGPIVFGQMRLETLTLFRSELTKTGPVYTPVHVFPLGKSK